MNNKTELEKIKFKVNVKKDVLHTARTFVGFVSLLLASVWFLFSVINSPTALNPLLAENAVKIITVPLFIILLIGLSNMTYKMRLFFSIAMFFSIVNCFIWEETAQKDYQAKFDYVVLESELSREDYNKYSEKSVSYNRLEITFDLKENSSSSNLYLDDKKLNILEENYKITEKGMFYRQYDKIDGASANDRKKIAIEALQHSIAEGESGTLRSKGLAVSKSLLLDNFVKYQKDDGELSSIAVTVVYGDQFISFKEYRNEELPKEFDLISLEQSTNDKSEVKFISYEK